MRYPVSLSPTLIAKRRAILAVALCVLGSSVLADADSEAARRAVQRGEIRPLTEILSIAAKTVPGNVIGVELDEDHGRFIYELAILTPRGRLLEMEIDAATGTVLKVEDETDD